MSVPATDGAHEFVVHPGQEIRLLSGDPIDRFDRGRPGDHGGDRRIDDPRIAGKQRLGLEDRANLLAGPGRGLAGQLVELGAGGRQGIAKAKLLSGRVRGR